MPGKPLQPSLTFASKALAYDAKYYTWMKMLARDEQPNLCDHFVSDEENVFVTLTTGWSSTSYRQALGYQVAIYLKTFQSSLTRPTNKLECLPSKQPSLIFQGKAKEAITQ